MTDFFTKRDPWGHGWALWVLVGMLFVAPLAINSLRDLRMENDVENWLPQDDPQARTLTWFRDHFSDESRMLVSWDDSSLTDPRIERFARLLDGEVGEDGIRRNGLKQVQSVITPHEALTRMTENQVTPEEAFQRMQGLLIGTGKLKVQLSEVGKSQLEHVQKMLQQQASSKLGLKLEFSPAFEEPTLIAGDDAVDQSENWQKILKLAEIPAHDFQVHFKGIRPKTAEVQQLRDLALSLQDPGPGGTAPSKPLIETCFFSPGTPVAMSVALSEAGVADRNGAIAEIRRLAEEAGVKEVELHMGGQPVAGAALNEEVQKAAWNTSYPLTKLHKRSGILLSGLVGIVLAYVLLRSFRLATLVLVVSYYTVLVTVALVPATGETFNMVLFVMPTLLLVLTLSGAIHVANYWKHAAQENPANAISTAAQMARQPCMMASLTTAIGLLSLMTSSLVPVRNFGIYSAAGCLVALLMVLYALPSLLQFWPAQPPASRESDGWLWERMGRWFTRHGAIVAAMCIATFFVSGYGLRWFRTETKVIRYFPEEARVVQDYYFLEENLAGIVPVETIVRFDQQAQQEWNFLQRLELIRKVEDRLKQHPEISGTISLADFRPVAELPGENANRVQKLLFTKKANETEKKIKDGEIAGTADFLTMAKSSADLNEAGDHQLAKEGDELWRITAQTAVMSDVNYGELTSQLNELIQSELKYYAGAGHVVTGMIPLFLRTQQAVLESLIKSFGLAFCIIAVVMMFLLRNPIAGLLSMLPNLLPVVVVFGLITWSSLAVDVGTMITASVALGVAVDGTLHLLTWFQDGLKHGKSRQEAVSKALGHCGPAMFQTSVVVGLGMMLLYPCDLLLVSRFGWLMASLIGAALVGDLVFLPALLAGPLGALIERTVRTGVESAESAPKLTAVPKPHVLVAKWKSKSRKKDRTH